MDNNTSKWKQFFTSKLGLIGTLLIVFFVYVAVFAPLIAPYDPFARVDAPYLEPSGIHLLGTNDIGQDIFSELIYGTRISLLMGVVSALVAILVGSVIGVCAGYFGGRVDAVLMRVVDIALTIPMLPLQIVLAAFLGSSYWNIILVIGLLSWASPARVIRSQVLTVKNRGYIQAVKCLGGRPFYIMTKHVLPQTISIIISQFILLSSRAILMETSLSFLGLGDVTQKSWGIILYYAQAKSAFLTSRWVWWILPPGLCITLLVIAFTYVGNALEDVINPRLRKEVT